MSWLKPESIWLWGITLSATSILLTDLPDKTARKLPKYPQVPATLLGRLAIDSRFQGKGYDELMLMDALRRALQAASEVASFAVVVDAIDEHAQTFYAHYEFRPFSGRTLRLFLPMKTIADLFYNGLSVLDYMVTSNHIHLLTMDNGGRNVIPDSKVDRVPLKKWAAAGQLRPAKAAA